VRGGPAPTEMTRYLRAARELWAADEARREELRRRLDAARALRRQWIEAVLQGGMPGK